MWTVTLTVESVSAEPAAIYAGLLTQLPPELEGDPCVLAALRRLAFRMRRPEAATAYVLLTAGTTLTEKEFCSATIDYRDKSGRAIAVDLREDAPGEEFPIEEDEDEAAAGMDLETFIAKAMPREPAAVRAELARIDKRESVDQAFPVVVVDDGARALAEQILGDVSRTNGPAEPPEETVDETERRLGRAIAQGIGKGIEP